MKTDPVKLRLHGNSIRLRLTRREVETFAAEGKIEDAVEFPGGVRLAYSLEALAETTGVYAHYEGQKIRVLVPLNLAREWTATERVGIDNPTSSSLHILIEKDFQCLHGKGEPDPEEYPNPLFASKK